MASKFFPPKSGISSEVAGGREREAIPELKQPELKPEDIKLDLSVLNIENLRGMAASARPRAEIANIIPGQLMGTGPDNVEANARETVIRMFKEAPNLDQQFTFLTMIYGGEAYVQSMRTVLSRARQSARQERRKLTEFKLLLVDIKRLPAQKVDEVTVVRTQRSSLKSKSVYDDLIATLTKET